MAKAKAAVEKVQEAAEGIGNAMKNGTDTLKAGFEKAVKSYDKFVEYGKENVAAYTKSATAASKTAESLHNQLYSFTKSSVEDSFGQAKALLGIKSIQELIELQTDFAKSSFDTYVSELTKVGEVIVAGAKETIEPLQGRITALAEVVQNVRAV